MALDGDLVYASGETNVSLQKPTFSVLVEEQVLTISDFKAGLWDGGLDVSRLQVHLPSKEKKLRFETQLTLDGARSQSIIDSFSADAAGCRSVELEGRLANQRRGEVPMDHPENFRWNGDMALDGDLVYASGETNVSLQKPTFSVRVESRCCRSRTSRRASGMGVSMFRGCRSLWPRRRRNCESKRSSHSTTPGCNRSSTVLARLGSSLLSFRWTGRVLANQRDGRDPHGSV